MSLSDESWKGSYDAWKLASPDDEREQDECYHEEHEIDWEGRAECQRCGETWWASDAEIETQRVLQADYDAWCRKQERREFWLRLTLPIRMPIHRLLSRIWPRKACSVLDDDEIPF